MSVRAMLIAARYSSAGTTHGVGPLVRTASTTDAKASPVLASTSG
jgi:hypothetical protein